jgi:hypothetical protein
MQTKLLDGAEELFAQRGGEAGADAFNSAAGGSPQLPAPDAEHDIFMAMMEWTNDGVPPDRVVATRFLASNPKQIDYQRPFCAYPKMPPPGAAPAGTAESDIPCQRWR